CASPRCCGGARSPRPSWTPAAWWCDSAPIRPCGRRARKVADVSRPSAHEHRPDAFTEFAEELRMLAETVLERVEPTLRSAAEDRPEWSSCSWCPVCATAALVRGEHHDVLTALADHGTAIVTVLREALAGAPVEPVMPEDDGPHHSGRDHD